jgi:uncharacterized protein YcaQ
MGRVRRWARPIHVRPAITIGRRPRAGDRVGTCQIANVGRGVEDWRSMPNRLAIDIGRARQLAVIGQLLSLPRPRSIEETVRGLFAVQMDPTSSIARTEHLVLWSRLGERYRPAALERLLWKERSLFCYRAHIVPTSDLELHHESMRRYPHSDGVRHRYVRDWLAANGAFRRDVLRQLRRDGPLRTRDLQGHTAAGWRTGGWNDEGNDTAMMLEILWARGEVMLAGRQGQERVWDVAERWLPPGRPRSRPRKVARIALERQLRALGIARIGGFGFLLDGRPDGWEEALTELLHEEVAVRLRVEGVRGDWYAHADVLERSIRPRTVLLSPFDQLVHDRRRTEQLFGFRFRLEIYVPAARREFGYYVLPILHADRLVGRLDPTFDRRTNVLRVRAIWAEPDAPAEAGPAVADEIASLGRWLGASDVQVGERPRIWRAALDGL